MYCVHPPHAANQQHFISFSSNNDDMFDVDSQSSFKKKCLQFALILSILNPFEVCVSLKIVNLSGIHFPNKLVIQVSRCRRVGACLKINFVDFFSFECIFYFSFYILRETNASKWKICVSTRVVHDVSKQKCTFVYTKRSFFATKMPISLQLLKSLSGTTNVTAVLGMFCVHKRQIPILMNPIHFYVSYFQCCDPERIEHNNTDYCCILGW